MKLLVWLGGIEMEICIDVMIDIFAKYQLLMFLYRICLITGIFFISTGIVWAIFKFSDETWFYSKHYNHYINVFSFEYHIASSVLCIIVIIMGLCGLFLSGWANYQWTVILKPELARYITPFGVDLINNMTAEVQDMWNLLKDLLK